jgi:hypothetical protein
MCECNFPVYNYHLVLGPLFQEGLSDISISAVRELNSHAEDNYFWATESVGAFFLIPRGAVLRRKLLIETYLRMVLKLKQGKMQLDTIRTQIQHH